MIVAGGHKAAAIFSRSPLVVKNCTFKNNNATSNGGAIYVTADDENTIINISNSVFTNNTANDDYDGGAIAGNNIIYIVNCTFKNNKAVEGAAIASYHKLKVKNSTFIENFANSNGNGGAIMGESIEIDSCTFINNRAEQDAGVIYVKKDATIENSIFENNRAGPSQYRSFGGVIRSKGYLTIDSCNFTNNYVTDRGGVIYSDDKLILRGYNNFIGNNANDYGGAIYSKGDVYINWVDNGKATFKSNRAITDAGGAIYSEKNIYMRYADFTDNYADDYGGAIFSKDLVTAKSSIFTNNYAKNFGGAVFCHREDVWFGVAFFSNVLFKNNKAGSHGGAIYADYDVNLDGDNDFIANEAHDFGGAIYIYHQYMIHCLKFVLTFLVLGA